MPREQSHASHLLLTTYHFWGPNQSLTLQAEDLCYPFSGPENPLHPQLNMATNRLRRLLKPQQSKEEERALAQEKLREEHEAMEQKLHDEIENLASLQIKGRRSQLLWIMSSVRKMINEQNDQMERLEGQGKKHGTVEWEEAQRYQAGLYWRLSEAESMLRRGGSES